MRTFTLGFSHCVYELNNWSTICLELLGIWNDKPHPRFIWNRWVFGLTNLIHDFFGITGCLDWQTSFMICLKHCVFELMKPYTFRESLYVLFEDTKLLNWKPDPFYEIPCGLWIGITLDFWCEPNPDIRRSSLRLK